ncbi:hypothetical protein REPUB_Repub07fG0033200 [Reevesia pubescens]
MRKILLQLNSRCAKFKKVQLASSCVHIKSPDGGNVRKYRLRDRISQLPDDILISILSSMKLKEAAVTSLLSRRWRYLWLSVSRLNFYFSDLRDILFCKPELCEVEKEKFIHWVNSVVKMHQGLTLDEFRVDFPLDKNSSHVVDAWLKFAFSKRVQQLVLELSAICFADFEGIAENYTFSSRLLPDQTRMSSRRSSFSDICSKSPCCSLVGLTSLRTLHLKHVNVKEEVLEQILSCCLRLEELSVHGSAHLVNLNFSGPSLKLKYLSISRCHDLQRIEIYDTDIVSFKYFGRRIVLSLKNLPSLVELDVCPGFAMPISYAFDQISCCFSHLESLSLNFFGRMVREYHFDALPQDEDYFDIVSYPKLTKLKHLAVRMGLSGDFGLLKLVPLIAACPNLQRFGLQLLWDKPEMTRKVVETVKCPHQHLKVVELAGYYGRTTDLEFALYFIQNAVTLERMIISPRVAGCESEEDEIKQEEDAKHRAEQQLKGKVPLTVDLVISCVGTEFCPYYL